MVNFPERLKARRRSNLPTWFDIQKRAIEKYPRNNQKAQDEIDSYQLNTPYDGKKKLWERAPKKKDIHRHVASWQDSGFIHVAEARRFGKPPGKLAVQINHALVSYMKSTALRAPAMPVKATTKTLWRGMVVTPETYKAIQKTKVWHDTSFLSFTRNRKTAEHSANPTSIRERYDPSEYHRLKGKTVGILWKLDVTDVQRGTPWIWFADKDSTRGRLGTMAWHLESKPQHQMINKTWAPSQGILGGQEETLLPPGTLHVIDKPLETTSGAYIFRVKFVPHQKLESLYINPHTRKPDVSINLKRKDEKSRDDTWRQMKYHRKIFG
jgi:hypothetical protein